MSQYTGPGRVDCPACVGSGVSPLGKCSACGGKGYYIDLMRALTESLKEHRAPARDSNRETER